ncbi:transcription termination/antitermination protein NusG [Methylocystis sp. ATCC 49242]|uniref:transcription termination/antitermination protein NusG n=1 Tax=Methylocystis sp. ATCC 49242 TaxID=622637 RepID=UPI0001F87171|nr:transcription termination/antitermination NusG family protein [Methylocystis sp. ATCC 49242]
MVLSSGSAFGVTGARSSFELAPGERWYVAQTLARREAGAGAQLVAQGFAVFTPQVIKTVRHARKLRTVRAPAFPGYLFVILDLNRDRWRSVNGTFGVARMIMGEDVPMPVPAGVVETLLGYVDEAGVCRFDRDLVEGQAVRVTVGPFAQAIGELVRLDANGRVRVLLEIMGGKIPATLERSSLVAA